MAPAVCIAAFARWLEYGSYKIAGVALISRRQQTVRRARQVRDGQVRQGGVRRQLHLATARSAAGTGRAARGGGGPKGPAGRDQRYGGGAQDKSARNAQEPAPTHVGRWSGHHGVAFREGLGGCWPPDRPALAGSSSGCGT